MKYQEMANEIVKIAETMDGNTVTKKMDGDNVYSATIYNEQNEVWFEYRTKDILKLKRMEFDLDGCWYYYQKDEDGKEECKVEDWTNGIDGLQIREILPMQFRRAARKFVESLRK